MKDVIFSSGLESIGRFAFYGTNVKHITFPALLRTIAHAAFAGCRNLKTVKLNEGLEVLGTNEYFNDDGMPYGVFERSSVDRVELPSTLRRIEQGAFRECRSLRDVRLPDGLEYIGIYAFSGSGLRSVTLPGSVRTVSQGVFAACQDLRTAVLNEGLEILGSNEYAQEDELLDGVFQGSALESIKLPATLKRIEYSAFTYCANLIRI